MSLFPKGFRAAFEFRNDSWFTEETYTVLSDAAVALVAADTDVFFNHEDEGAGPALAERFVAEVG